MSRPFRNSLLSALFLLICLSAALGQPEPEPSPQPTAAPITSPVPDEFSSPAATLHTFLQSMDSSYPFSVHKVALHCLDLTKAPTLVKTTAGPQRAIKLYEILRYARIDLDSVPTEIQEDFYVLYRQPNGDKIAMRRGEDGQWKFDSETILAVVHMNELLVQKGTIKRWIAPHFSRRVFGLYLFQWCFLAMLWALGYLLGRFVLAVARTILRRKYPQIDTLAPPGILRGFPYLLGTLVYVQSLSYLDLSLSSLVFLTGVGKLLATVFAVWFCFGLVDVVKVSIPHFGAYKKVGLHNAILPMAARTMKVFVSCIGLLFLAQNLEINVWSLFAGFSVIGAMVALAGQDFVKNLFGSITVVLDQPFDIGDWVVIDGVEGTVEDVRFRSTRIRTFYNSLVTMPNSILLTAKIDNYGARKFRRYRQLLHISQRTPQPLIESFCEAVREIVRRHPFTRKDDFHVYLNDVTPDAIQILIYVYWQTPDWSTELAERHRFLSDVLHLAQRLGVELAPNTTRVQFTQWTPPESSDALYDYESLQQAKVEGESQARAIVNATFPPDSQTPNTKGKSETL
jgi:MscS family membrane protein